MFSKTFKLAATVATLGALALSTQAEAFERGNRLIYTGGVITGNDTYVGYIGGVVPVNGDFGKDGFLLQVNYEMGTYEYDGNQGVTPTEYDADYYGGGALLGYQKLFKRGRIAGYAGVAHRSTDTDPEPTTRSKSEGKRTGLKLQFEGTVDVIDPVALDTIASVVTSDGGYWTRNRVAIKPLAFGGNQGLFRDMIVGPEIQVHGNDDYDAIAYGAFIDRVPLGTEIVKLGGFIGAETISSQGTDAKGGINLTFQF